MYHESLDDEKLRLLAFEDRWHFVALLCCKAKGILDDGSIDLIRRKVAVKLGLAIRELDEVARRLDEVDLIDKDTLQPLAWDSRQCQSDKDETNAERQQRYRDAHKAPVTPRNALRNGEVTGIDAEEDKDKEEDKYKKTRASAPPDGVSVSVWADFKAVRKAKRMALTDTAIKLIRNQAENAGYTLQQALEICCERGWASFNSDWLDKVKPGAATETAYQRSKRELYERATGQNTQPPQFVEVLGALQ